MATVVCRLSATSNKLPVSLSSVFTFSQRKCKLNSRNFSTAKKPVDFGFLFDIDGVIVRGQRVLPSARAAFNYLIDNNGKFRVPVLFVTNAGNTLRQNKAKALSDWLGIEVKAEQVVMSHSPVKMFTQLHNKHVLVTGQGPVEEIARGLGFTNTSTMDKLRQCFPNLDKVDHSRRKLAVCAFENYFPRIEAVILFGETVRWETSIQLIVDLLMTNGQPSNAPADIPYPHIPVLACNMDLMWMSDACMPRIAHGLFLHLLEAAYHKISGRELKYTALVGKPSNLTYHHADYLLDLQAQRLGMSRVKTLYCIGDNPESDIYGANLYDRYLQKKHRSHVGVVKQVRQTIGQRVSDVEETDSDQDDYSSLDDSEVAVHCADQCLSILVCTGVYSSSKDSSTYGMQRVSNHNHRDFVLDPELTRPTYVTQNVLKAVELVFEKENFD